MRWQQDYYCFEYYIAYESKKKLNFILHEFSQPSSLSWIGITSTFNTVLDRLISSIKIRSNFKINIVNLIKTLRMPNYGSYLFEILDAESKRRCRLLNTVSMSADEYFDNYSSKIQNYNDLYSHYGKKKAYNLQSSMINGIDLINKGNRTRSQERELTNISPLLKDLLVPYWFCTSPDKNQNINKNTQTIYTRQR